MKFSRFLLAAALACPGSLSSARAEESALNPQVRKIIGEISEERVRATIQRLVSFGTRNLLSSQDDPARGIGAARKWIFEQLRGYSPRLQVRYDHWRVQKKAPRITRDVDLYNVVAVLPGTSMPEVQVVVSGHYDSLNLGTTPSVPGSGDAQVAIGERPLQSDWEKLADLDAPGACDDASGVAAVMELARVMSRYEFPKTLVFIAFSGEEEGLVGSTLEAAKAKNEKQIIEAVLNNDIIGSDISGSGRTGNRAVSVYSNESPDSGSQSLARYVRLVGERYLPSLDINPIEMPDRLGRGGDHSPFQQEGYSAVRFSTPNEILANEHHLGDTLENMSVPYTAQVARLNAAAMACLGLAPRIPQVMIQPKPLPTSPDTPRPPLPMVTRGKGYDAVLRWQPFSAANLKGYAIVYKTPGAPDWQHEIFVGNVTGYTLQDVSIDEYRFGVKAIGNDGAESPVAAYVFPTRTKVEYKTVE
jgi:hypothetical protein